MPQVERHPIADNPIRIAYTQDWNSLPGLLEHLAELKSKLQSKPLLADWEPYAQYCCRYRSIIDIAFARNCLLDSDTFALSMAFYADAKSTMGIANLILLQAEAESSWVSWRLQTLDGLEQWRHNQTDWVADVVSKCQNLGVNVDPVTLVNAINRELMILDYELTKEPATTSRVVSKAVVVPDSGYDTELLRLDGLLQNPGEVVLQSDRLWSSEALQLNLQGFKLQGKASREVAWNEVRSIQLTENGISFALWPSELLSVGFFKKPDKVLPIILKFHKAAVERQIKAITAQVKR